MHQTKGLVAVAKILTQDLNYPFYFFNQLLLKNPTFVLILKI